MRLPPNASWLTRRPSSRLPAAPLLCALVLLSVAVPVPARAAEAPAADSTVRVLEGWRYRWGEPLGGPGGAPAWAAESGDGAGWSPGQALTTPPGRDGQRLLWLSLPLPEGPWAAPGLLLESVSNVLEVYAGGRRIYVSGRLDPTGYETAEHSAWHVVPLPRSALGQRVLLRIQSSGRAIGVRGDVRVGELDVLRTQALRGSMDVFVLGAVLLFVAVGAAVAFAIRRQEGFGSLMVFAVSTGLVLTLMSGVPQALWGVGRPGFVLMLMGAYFAVPGLTSFVSSVVIHGRDARLPKAVRVHYALAALFSLALLTLHGSLPWLFPVYLLVMLVCVLGCAVLSAIEAYRGNEDARIFAVGVAGLLLAGILTALTSFGVLESVGFVMHWGLLALTASLLGILARRAMEVVQELQTHTRTLETQQQQVHRLAQRMGSGAVELLSAVGQLRASSAQQTAGVGRQAAALQEAQVTVAEIRQTSALTAEKAMMMAASTSEADEASREGMAALERTLSGLEGIRLEVSGMAQRIHALEARTREISSIVETVKGLADQSNMLALNAAIEAVRSGEHGKGFTVVAREVRNLADQSIEATQRIRDILESVGASMKEAAGASARGEERVRQSLGELQGSGEQLRKLALIVGETGASVREMTAAVAQQDAGTSQIASAIAHLSEQMQHTLQALQETEAVTRSVEQLAVSMSGTGAPTRA